MESDEALLLKMQKLAATVKRNEPCWCGSGLKYKRCHLHRAKEKPLAANLQETVEMFQRQFDAKYCLHPQAGPEVCNGGIIKAHTIQRNGGLSRIARDGHVYTVDFDLVNGLKGSQQNFVQLVGIKKASTFTGFCAFHDNKTFEPIEKHSFQPTPEDAFLLGYRSLCKELFLKKADADYTSELFRNIDKGRNVDEQVQLQWFFQLRARNVNLSLRELEQHKKLFDQSLLTADYSNVYYYIVEIGNLPEIMCSGGFIPETSFDGHTLNKLTNMSAKFDHIFFSLIGTDTGGAIVFTWEGKKSKNRRLVESLDKLSDVELPHAIVRFTFEFFENVYWSPDWWDKLAPSAQQALIKRQQTTGEFEPHSPSCLLDDGLRVVNWTIRSRTTNIAFT